MFKITTFTSDILPTKALSTYYRLNKHKSAYKGRLLAHLQHTHTRTQTQTNSGGSALSGFEWELKSDGTNKYCDSHTCSSSSWSISNNASLFFVFSRFVYFTVCLFQIGIFPEGTCTNRSGLIRFKAGMYSRIHSSSSNTCLGVFVGLLA